MSSLAFGICGVLKNAHLTVHFGCLIPESYLPISNAFLVYHIFEVR